MPRGGVLCGQGISCAERQWNIAEDRFQCGRRLFRAIEALDGKRDGVRSAHRPEVGLYIVISVHDRGRAALVPFRC